MKTGRLNRGVRPSKYADFVQAFPKRRAPSCEILKRSAKCTFQNVVQVPQTTPNLSADRESGSRRANRSVLPKKYRDFVECSKKEVILNGNSKQKSNPVHEELNGGSDFTGNDRITQVTAYKSPSESQYRKGVLRMRKRSQVRKIPVKKALSKPGSSSDEEIVANNSARPRVSYTELREQLECDINKLGTVGTDSLEMKLTPVKFLESVIPVAPTTKSRKIFLNDVKESCDDTVWEKQAANPSEKSSLLKRKGQNQYTAKATKGKKNQLNTRTAPRKHLCDVRTRNKRKTVSPSHFVEARRRRNVREESSSEICLTGTILPATESQDCRISSPTDTSSGKNNPVDGVRSSRIRKPSVKLTGEALYSWWSHELARKKCDNTFQSHNPTTEENFTNGNRCQSPEKAPSKEFGRAKVQKPSSRLMDPAEELEIKDDADDEPKTAERYEPRNKVISPTSESGDGRPSRVRKPSAKLIESVQYSASRRASSSKSCSSATLENRTSLQTERESCVSVVPDVPKTESEKIMPPRVRKPTLRLVESVQLYDTIGDSVVKPARARRKKTSKWNSRAAQEEQLSGNVQIESEEVNLDINEESTDIVMKSSRHYRFVSTRGKKVVQCAYCFYQTLNLNYFWTHMRIHTDKKPSRCDECSSTAIKNALQVHVRIHTAEKFPLVGAVVLAEDDIENVAEEETDEADLSKMDDFDLSPESHGCIICDFESSSFDCLASHMKIHL